VEAQRSGGLLSAFGFPLGSQRVNFGENPFHALRCRGCPTFIGDVPRRVVQAEGILYFAGGLCQAKPRTNEGNGLAFSSTLASRLLISIRIPLGIEKVEAPRSQDPAPGVVRDRGNTNFLKLRQGEVLRIRLL
jgi:hypothetical protein